MKKKGICMALSGGGYRALLFSLGSLWRMNEFGLLDRINCLTSVSGSSILSAYLAMKWKKLKFDSKTHVASNFKSVIAEPLQEFSSRGMDILAVVTGLFNPFKSISGRIAEIYADRLYGKMTIQDIPNPGEGPEFIFYGSSLQTGSGVQISKAAITDYKVGKYPKPELTLAKVVGISSAFPPYFAPVRIKLDPDKWKRSSSFPVIRGDDRFYKKLVLVDGGVYDNLGLEAVWKKSDYLFVCDASAPFQYPPTPRGNWFSQSIRALNIITDQTRRLRRRTVIADYQDFANGDTSKYGGAFWAITTKIKDYDLEDEVMVKDNAKTMSQQDVATRLKSLSPQTQGELINWGYALTDTALRKYYFTEPMPPGKWPIPEYALDK